MKTHCNVIALRDYQLGHEIKELAGKGSITFAIVNRCKKIV